MRRIPVAVGLASLSVPALAAAQDEWRSRFSVGQQVSFSISGSPSDLQPCIVSDNPAPDVGVMRVRCQAFKQWSAGSYIVYGPSYIRDGGSSSAGNNGNIGGARSAATRPQAAPARSGYRVGQAVELEASGHWVPCTVSETDPILRVRCTAYPALSRAAGEYIVHNEVTGIRPATGRIGPAAPARPAATARQGTTPGGTLRNGEYACYGSGGRIMLGLGFRVVGPGRYTDLEGNNRGSFTVSGGNVRFSGGRLGGQVGRNLTSGGSFAIGAQAECEPY